MAEPLRDRLLAHALAKPAAWEDHPWEESVAKVGKKVFLFINGLQPDAGARFTVKLPDSFEEALLLPWVTPAGYGLDRGRWVTVDAPDDAPIDMLLDWIDESYRAVAPRRVLASR
jgi:predicted DNA-binding protein (MmcQ/YjbR family)